MLAYVGMDPKEVNWMPGTTSLLDAMDAYTRGKADAFVGFAQQPVELRAKKIGNVIVNTTTDRPWSQYYCCMLGANREFVQRYPVTTKRPRAILKAADMRHDPLSCALPVGQTMNRASNRTEVVKSLPGCWREANLKTRFASTLCACTRSG
jgi:hypothetical protein